MYRKLLPLIFLLQPITVFALSCPNNGKIISTGDSKETIIATCGEPLKVITKNNDTLIDGRLVYTNANGGAILTIVDGHVSNIKVSTACDSSDCSEPVSALYYTACEKFVNIGNNLPFVYRVCGEPLYTYSSTIDQNETEWLIYSSDGGPNTLVIHNGQLSDWDEVAPTN